MRYLTLSEVLDLHALVLEKSGGIRACADRNGLESAVAQPEMTFGRADLYSHARGKGRRAGLLARHEPPFS